ncbi:SusC/RagA family TonB-linked outer membrane protein [Gynurincola endophyticus]|uniref:SusC/RagA family TonB-linked outer membrane protein n=1 Tax=Gynurincola endophyticus TaxID=2479004 RepID=UPI000F8EC98F|nr:TonB-dependent receptor [Gynurincola endophyticus]
MKLKLKRSSRLSACILLCSILSLQALAQTRPLIGTILDENSKVMSGVTVEAFKINDTAAVLSTMTNSQGIFRLNLTPGVAYNFRASFIGYETQQINRFVIKDGENNSLMIKMKIDVREIEEVIVVGYGTQKKMNLSGAVQQIEGDELRDRPATNITSLLQGAIPNLNIRVSSGMPGQMGSLNIRGITSISGSNAVNGAPLVIIDGVPGTLDRLNPEEVQTISVLKDASAAAIYGARGAFGVILVTTKNGTAGKTAIRYNNNWGASTPTVSTDFMTTAYDWMRLNDAALAHVGGYSGYTERDYEELYARRNDKVEDPSRPWVTVQNRNGRDQYVYYGNYDWWDIMFTKWQASQNHNVFISGGSETVNYMINGNLKSKDGIMRMNTDKYGSKTLRTKVNAQINPWLRISNNTNFYHMSYDYFGRDGGGSANFTHVNVHASPAYAPINPDGTASYRTGLNNYDIGDGIFAMLISGNTRGLDRKYELTTINEIGITPLKNWNITANYSYNLYTDPSFYRQTAATYSLYPGTVEVAPKYAIDKLSESQQFNQVHVMNLYSDYTRSFNNHNFKILAGLNQELSKAKRIGATIDDLSSEELNSLNLGTGLQTVSGNSSEVALAGLFYRFNYDFAGKYILETSGRYDGSSRFPSGRRRGFFPSVSAAWRISEENFFLPLNNVISDLKFRGSIGSLGNQQISSAYPYIPTMRASVMNYILGGEKARSYSVPNPVSGSFTWETAITYNGGIDVSFFRNRLNISFDKYIRNTEDILASDVKLPSVYGASEPIVNVATIQTKGFELAVNYRDHFMLLNKPFKYSFNVALSDNHSVVKKINNPTKLTYSLYEGKEIGEIWGYITDGFFQTDAEARTYPVDQVFLNRVRRDNNIPIRAGDLRWLDLDGDNVISAGKNTIDDPGDQRVIGNSTPRYMYSFGGNANWNNFDISFFFQGLGKMDWYPGNNADRFWGPYSRPYFSFIPNDFEKDVYSPDNTNAYFPNLLAYVALNANNELRATNNRYLQDLAYLRLKNLTIGYTVPNNITKRALLKGLRVYVSGENLFTFTKLRSKYIDPEQAMSQIDGRVYPFSKTISFGIDMSF